VRSEGQAAAARDSVQSEKGASQMKRNLNPPIRSSGGVEKVFRLQKSRNSCSPDKWSDAGLPSSTPPTLGKPQPPARTRTHRPLHSSDMQTDNARYVVRLSGALAALLGRSEGAELPEDDVLGCLRAQGLMTYPSPLLGGLHGELAEVLAAEVLPRLDPTDLAVFGRVGRASRAAVVASGLPRAGASVRVPLRLKEMCGSVERLDWAWANGWDGGPDVRVCQLAAAHGHLEVLIWARERGCPLEAGAYTDPLLSST